MRGVPADANMAVNYRLLVIFAAVIGAVFSAFSVVWIIEAFILYRSEDFIIASETLDWMDPPAGQATCVETLTDAQLMSLDYDHPDLACRLDNDMGNKLNMRNSLAVSVHGLYYLAKNRATRQYVGDVPNPLYTQAPDKDENGDDIPGTGLDAALDATIPAVLSAILKETFDDDGARPPSVNFASAYRALHWVSDLQQHEETPGVPTNCDTIYGKTYAVIEGDVNLTNFIDNLRLGRKKQYDIGKTTAVKDTWPLNDILVDCNDNDDDPTTPYTWTAKPGSVGSVITSVDALTTEEENYLYAHCYAQFLYASVGSQNKEGVFAVPFVERSGGDIGVWYTRPTGYNATASYSQKVRLQLGYRYGMSLWAYVPMLLCSCILLGDAIVFFFSEITMPNLMADMDMYSDNRIKQIRDSLVIAANTSASRTKRLAFCLLAFFCSVMSWLIFIGFPYGIVFSTLPRPICEKGDNGYGTKPKHNFNPFFGQWRGTHGGWQSDWDATWYELAALFCQLFVLALLPLTTTALGRDIESSISNGDKKAGREVKANAESALERVRTSAKYVEWQGRAFWLFTLGVLVMILGQSISNANFGMAWAEGVMALKKDEYGDLIYDEIRIADLVYDSSLATFAVVVSCGLVFGALLARRYIAGLGCYATFVFLGWLVLAFVFFLPLMTYASIRAIFNHDEANSDCSVFDHGARGYLVPIKHNDLCTLRYWSFIVGGGILAVTILMLTALGIPEIINGTLDTRKKALVEYTAGPNMSKFFRQGPSMRTNQALYDAEDLTTPLGGYQSAEECRSTKFFAFKTSLGKTDSNILLYAPRMGASSRR